MYCSNCGNRIPDGSGFCPFCGTAVKKIQQKSESENEQYVQAEQIAPAADTAARYAAPAAPESYRTVETVQAEPTYANEPAVCCPPDETPYEAAQPFPPAVPSAFQAQPGQPAESKPAGKRKGKALFFVLGGAALVAVAAAVLIPISIHNDRQTRYNEGAELLENGEYAAAEEIFLSLGSFDDSADMAAYAGKGVKYESAVRDMRSGEYRTAKQTFDSIAGFKDSSALSKQCAQGIDYTSAMEYYNAGDYENAEALFYQTGDFLDALKLAAECGSRNDYADAKALMAEGSYEMAEDLLEPLPSKLFPDKDELIAECDNMQLYLEAQSLRDSGSRYEAYTLFNSLGNFRDSSDMAAACTVPKPRTGETYHNGAYISSACTLIIKPPKTDGSSTYFKLYSTNGDLVSSVFINAGDEARIDIPSGDYRFKSAYGYGDWFGENDMFGDDGVYEVLKSNSTSEIFTLKYNYSYTLSLRTVVTDGGGIPTRSEERQAF